MVVIDLSGVYHVCEPLASLVPLDAMVHMRGQICLCSSDGPSTDSHITLPTAESHSVNNNFSV